MKKPEVPPTYSIIRTEEFIFKSNELRKKYSRLTELNQAIDWALARKPHFFNQFIGEFYFLITEELANPQFPDVKIFYRILEKDYRVVLIDIEEN
jgi:hypothetical protein